MTTDLNEEKIDFLVKWTKASRKFEGLDDSVIAKEIVKKLKENAAILKDAREKNAEHLRRNSKVRDFVRDVRASLFMAHGMYYGKGLGERYELLKELKENINENEGLVRDILKKILHSHSSSRERFSFYGGLYKDIFVITGTPSRILDVSCGLNPVSFPLMGIKNVEYIASEFSNRDCDLLSEYFKIVGERYGVKGEVIHLNLFENEDFQKLGSIPAVDVCFLWKVVDVLDRKGHSISERVVKAVKARYVVVSFSTKTLSGKLMKRSHRRWFEVMLERNEYPYRIIEKKNEAFYVIKK